MSAERRRYLAPRHFFPFASDLPIGAKIKSAQPGVVATAFKFRGHPRPHVLQDRQGFIEELYLKKKEKKEGKKREKKEKKKGKKEHKKKEK